MVERLRRLALWAATLGLLTGCGGVWTDDARPIRLSADYRERLARDPALMRRILAIDPLDVTPEDVRNTLSRAPAPWLLPISPAFPGPVFLQDFLDFLVDMGYPRERIGDPRDRDYKISYLESSETVAGLIAWLYERDGLSPMIVGWSAGAIMTMAILHDLDRSPRAGAVKVVNGLTGRAEDRSWIRDPYTGRRRPIRGVQVSLAGILAAGGLGRLTQVLRWGSRPPLRRVPDSARELIAFHAPNDVLGTDFLALDSGGFAKANEFVPAGKAKVRTIIADDSYGHVNLIHCNLLSRDPGGRKWVESYRPDPGFGVRDFRGDARLSLVEGKRNLWCGEFWYAVKKNWAIEAQRAARFFLRAGHRGGRGAIP